MSAALRTERLVLMPFVENDAEALFKIRGDAEAMTHWDWPSDVDFAATRIVARGMAQEMRGGTATYWTARDAAGGFVGVFDLSALLATSAEIGFMVARERWGHGLALEGARALIVEARRRGIAGLTARIHADNIRSALLLARLGFEESESQRAAEIRPGILRACRFYLRRLEESDDADTP